MAAVFQAYGGAHGPDAARVADVAAALAGLEHHEPGPPAYKVYGLSFVAPEGFALASFAFVPGRFSLTFAAKGRRLDVVRLAPAEVILAQASLGDTAARTFGLTDATLREAGDRVRVGPRLAIAATGTRERIVVYDLRGFGDARLPDAPEEAVVLPNGSYS